MNNNAAFSQNRDKKNFGTYRSRSQWAVVASFGFGFGCGNMVGLQNQGVTPAPYFYTATLAAGVISLLFNFYFAPKALKEWRNYRENMWNVGKLKYPIHEAPSLKLHYSLNTFMMFLTGCAAGFLLMAAVAGDKDLAIYSSIGFGVVSILTIAVGCYSNSKFLRDTKSFQNRQAQLFQGGQRQEPLLASREQAANSAVPNYGAVQS